MTFWNEEIHPSYFVNKSELKDILTHHKSAFEIDIGPLTKVLLYTVWKKSACKLNNVQFLGLLTSSSNILQAIQALMQAFLKSIIICTGFKSWKFENWSNWALTCDVIDIHNSLVTSISRKSWSPLSRVIFAKDEKGEFEKVSHCGAKTWIMLLRVHMCWLRSVSLLEALVIGNVSYHGDNELQTFKECND